MDATTDAVAREMEPQRSLRLVQKGQGGRRAQKPRPPDAIAPPPAGHQEVVASRSADQVVQVPLSEIDLADETFQYRFPTSVASLRASLLLEGQHEPVDLMPVDLMPGKSYRIIDGFRRTAVATALGWTHIKAFMHEGITEETARRLAWTKNVVRRNLGPTEKAHAMLLATKQGVIRSELAAAFGISEKQVSRYLGLLDFPKPILDALEAGDLKMSHAKVLADLGVQDVEMWTARVESERLDSKGLNAAILKENPKAKRRGRARQFATREKGKVRLYSARLDRDSSDVDKRNAIKALESALEALKGWL